VDCILAEADKICGGVTKNTTAKITLGHGFLYQKLLRRFGEETARTYFQAQEEACKEYARLCKQIDCDYEEKNHFVYSLTDPNALESELSALSRIGADAKFSETAELPFPTKGAVCYPHQAQFNPLKFLFSLAEDLPIYEHTRVLHRERNKAYTSRGEIRFEKMIVATHFPLWNRHGLYPIKLYQSRARALVLKGAIKMDGMYVDEAQQGLSFRRVGENLLFIGGSYRTGKETGAWRELEDFATGCYKKVSIAARYANQDCMSLDGIPYIGQYAKATPDIFVATGFNQWGMTGAMVASKLLSDLICKRESPYESVFSPSRRILTPQLAVNVATSAAGLLTPTAPRCPHLGCALHYNRAEHSWDCACHGSRFTRDGRLLDSPATGDHPSISRKEKK